MNLKKISLTEQKCVPCEGTQPLIPEAFKPYLAQLQGWNVIVDTSVEKEFKFKNFKEALEFINKVGELAEDENHHPDILLHGWNKVKIVLSTHTIKGLSLNDFIVAAKIDKLLTV